MPAIYLICAAVLLLAAPAGAQNAAAPAKTAYNVFVRGTSLGREEVTVAPTADGTSIVIEGRLGAPVNAVTRRAEIKYRSDWSPVSFELEGNVNGGEVSLRTAFTDGMASTEGMQGTNRIQVSHMTSRQTLVLPNGLFGAFAAVSRRLASVAPGTELRAYLLPIAEVALRVESVATERMQTGTTMFNVRRYALALATPGTPLAVTLVAAEDGSLLRVTIPAQSIDVLREDLAASTSRTQIYSNPGDEAVTIAAPGFNIGATITHPRTAPPGGKTGAVILLAGSGVGDRDGVVFNIPILAQLAGTIADAGLLAVRYDKRGYGQSGGRAESATISDYADDARVVVKWLADRKDIDPRRIAIVGHSEGAMVAFIAASRDRRIAAVASLDGPASTGADLVLEQQQHALDLANTPPAERESKVALEKQILEAVRTGQGWDALPPELRRQADTPWFQSLITYDPAKVLDDVRQPILIVHGELDRQVPVAHADRLAALARKVSNSKAVDVVIVRGVNHLLVPATTGEVTEYASLPDRTVSKDVTAAVTGWLTKTFQSVK